MTRSPFCWLAARDRRPAMFAWAFLGVAVLAWLAGWAAMGAAWLAPGNAILSSIVLHLGLNWILAYSASKRLAEERQSGGFEVLLTVPLEPKAIVDGQCRALWTQFRTVWVGILCWMWPCPWAALRPAVGLAAHGCFGCSPGVP